MSDTPDYIEELAAPTALFFAKQPSHITAPVTTPTQAEINAADAREQVQPLLSALEELSHED